MPQIRVDRAQSGSIKRLSNGYIRVPITAARCGILVYKDASGKEWRELRLPEEVFHTDSLESLRGVPVTNDHPAEMLNSENTREHQIGHVHDSVEADRIYIKTKATITDKKAIDAALAGKRELSPGYVCDVEMKSGIYQGERYDAIQRNIRYNHVALVKQGRAGPEVRLHLDSADNSERVLRFDSIIETGKPDSNHGGESMKGLVVDGVEYMISPEAHAAITTRFTRDSATLTDLNTKLQSEKAERVKDQGRLDSLSDEVKELKAREPKMDEDSIRKRVTERVGLERFAATRLDTDLSKMSDDEIITALIQKKNKDFKLDSVDESNRSVYLRSRLDHMMETETEPPATGEGYNQGRKAAGTGVRNDDAGTPKSANEARAAFMEKQANRWKEPVGKH